MNPAVSIHAPRVGRDGRCRVSPLPRGVSIHAPRVGRDGRVLCAMHTVGGFNPRAPRGARRLHYNSFGFKEIDIQFREP